MRSPWKVSWNRGTRVTSAIFIPLESSLVIRGEISINSRWINFSLSTASLLSRVIPIVIDRDGRRLEFRLGCGAIETFYEGYSIIVKSLNKFRSHVNLVKVNDRE